MSVRKLVKRFIPTRLFIIIEPYGHLAEAVLLNTINGFPARNMKVIGVTGTNGKTTTVFMIHRMLTEAGYKTGMMSTVAYGVGNDIHPQMTHMTTQTVPVLMKRLKKMKSEGVEWLVLETTSQALAQNRVWGIPYSIAVMTNLTHDHLTYHRTFERYRAAKVKLFTMTNNNQRGKRVGIVNADDPNKDYFCHAITNVVTYGKTVGDLKSQNIQYESHGLRFDAVASDTIYHIQCHIPGSFNVENSLAAVCVGRVVGLTPDQIEQGIMRLTGVEGRMTAVNEGQNFSVIVDYAHTPDSFKKLFTDIKPHVKGKLIVVFGSLGGGDTEKRAVQGELAGTYADIVVLCEEDDRGEDPDIIINTIAQGVLKAGKIKDNNLYLIHDRASAIEFAIARANPGDCVLLLGKGHEKTIEHADGEHPWDEIAVAKAAIHKRPD